LLSSDVYRTLRKTPPTPRQLMRVVRANSVGCGALMLTVAWLLQYTNAGAVKANLTMVGILDMPLFVVTVIYGMAWRRTNWQGAVAGFVAGGLAGVGCYLLIDPALFHSYVQVPVGSASTATGSWLSTIHDKLAYLRNDVRNLAPIASSGAA